MKTRRTHSRPTIGLLTDWLEQSYQATVYSGVASKAREQDANLVCFVAGGLNEPYERIAQRNVIYDLVDKESVDGLIVASGDLSNYVTPEEFKAFINRYKSLPRVSIALELEDAPSITVDNKKGMHDAVVHLIETHGHRRIVFICGPEGHSEAEARYSAYVEALTECEIPLDPTLVIPGDFSLDGGTRAAYTMLDGRGLRPAIDFDAVIAANDAMAISVLEVLTRRGIKVPDDVALVGFDDTEESQLVLPPLTTVRQPMYEQGRQAAELLLALLAGKDVPDRVTLPTKLVVRQSCGCFPQEVLQVPAGTVRPTGQPLRIALPVWRESTLSAIEKAGGSDVLTQADQENLLDAFAASLESRSPEIFLGTLDKALRPAIATGQDMTAWYHLLSIVRHNTLAYLSRRETLHRAEDLWHQAFALVGLAAQQAQRYRAFHTEQQTATLGEINAVLGTTFDIPALMDAIARELPRLNIPGCYLALYEEEKGVPAKWSRLMLAYNENGRVELEPGGRRFPSRRLLPVGVAPPERRYTLTLMPLYFQEDHLGFVLFETGLQIPRVYEVLCRQISSALKGALLLRSEKRALLLQTAAEVSRAASSILDPDELIRQVVQLARERFDLYYAGLFLVDESGRWAVLRAGTGEAGQKMLEQGHKLEIGGASMIGWCIANKRARIALDVGAEAVRFDNPFLPETRSELALPLISRGEAIGALTIQSTREVAFSEEDIAVLQTMADQLANAITNARLYEQAQQEIAERQRAEAALAQQAQELTESLEQFARVAAHDLQEPLRMVASYAQLLAQRYRGRLDPEADEFIGYAVEGATRMHRLINDLLAYWHISTRAQTIEPVDCSALVDRVLSNLDGAIQASGATVNCDPMPTVMADATQLTQVFQHLLINAIQFRGERPLQIHICAERQDGAWRFSVSDNGIGIEPRYFERIFALFQPLQRQKEHSGIGLAICKKIVERHGGRIWVASEPGKGSTFYFTIPHK